MSPETFRAELKILINEKVVASCWLFTKWEASGASVYLFSNYISIDVSSISAVAPVGSSVGALYQKLYIQSKSAPEDGRICRPKHVGLI